MAALLTLLVTKIQAATIVFYGGRVKAGVKADRSRTNILSGTAQIQRGDQSTGDESHFIGITSNRPSAFITASYRPRGSNVWFYSASFGSQLSATVYFTASPLCLRRMMMIAIAPTVAFSGAICSVRCPTLATVAIATPSATQAHGALSLWK